jgi:hypothetical protein
MENLTSPLISYNTVNPEIDDTLSGANADAIRSTVAPVRYQEAYWVMSIAYVMSITLVSQHLYPILVNCHTL